MTDLTPKQPYRPLLWTDAVYDIRDLLADNPSPIYIVGGAVRDALLNRPIKDLDLATPGDAIRIARRIANHFPNGAFYIMDKERGVARALIETMHGDMLVDVAHFRGQNDADLLADLRDRDFTINAMVVKLHGDLSLLIDPLGGEQDMAKKQVRRCQPGAIAADPVRALRAIRQTTQLKFHIEPDTLREIREQAGQVAASTSAERVRDEFYNVLNLVRPVGALRVMDALGLLDDVLGINALTDKPRREYLLTCVEKMTLLVNALLPHRRDANLAQNFSFGLALMQLNPVRSQLEAHVAERWPNERPHAALLNLLMLLPDYTDQLDELVARLRLSNAEKKRLSDTIAALDAVYTLPDTSDLALHRFWYPLRAAGVDVCLYTLAEYLAAKGPHLQQDAWLTMIDRVKTLLEAYYLRYDDVVSPPPLVDGKTLITALGIEPGQLVGDLLDTIREAQVTGDITTPQGAIAFAQDQLT